MPGLDGTGPFGQGAMTGRGLGPCDYGMRRGFLGRGYGRGLGRRFGFGRGFGFGYAQRTAFTEPLTLTKAEQKKILEAELKEIEAEKQEIENELKELK